MNNDIICEDDIDYGGGGGIKVVVKYDYGCVIIFFVW